MISSVAYLSIGSNRGNKKENLMAAIAALDRHDRIDVVAVSRFYRTEPQNFTDQAWFVNAALKVTTTAGPEALLKILKEVETALDLHGKPFRFGPRKIDLDIIYFGDQVVKTDGLEVPHPRMQERCFVLEPLCDIGADTVHPILKRTTEQLLNTIKNKEGQGVIPLDQEA
jgi:2-amino-4-hydroxy-6-hydroxymethyldihydropteridine diphosphokinase